MSDSLGASGPREPLIGTVIDGRYRVDGLLGEGGMGRVYAARHVHIDKRFAIKVLKNESEDAAAVERFRMEAQALSRITHPNVIGISDFGQLPDGAHYFVMELLEVRPLSDVLACGPLEAARAVRIARQVALGLHATHANGIVHRDLKAENVFLVEQVDGDEQVKILDFGIARNAQADRRLTQTGLVVGTPDNIAPERISGQEGDHRVDVYALGCLLYEMLTGEAPFDGGSTAEIMAKHLYETPDPPSRRAKTAGIDPALDEVVLRAIRKKPEERFPDMAAFLRALDGLAGSSVSIAGAAASEARDSGRSRAEAALAAGAVAVDEEVFRPRRPWKVVVPAALVLLLGVGLAWQGLARRAPPPASPPPSSAAPQIAAVPAPAGQAAPPPARAATPPTPRPAVVPLAKTPSDTPAPTIAKTPAAAPAPTVAKTPAPAQVHLQLVSKPTGATVLVDGKVVGTTPRELVAERRAEPLAVVFRLAGHEDLEREVSAEANARIEVTLAPARRSRRRHPARSHNTLAHAETRRSPIPAEPVHETQQPAPPPSPASRVLRDPFK